MNKSKYFTQKYKHQEEEEEKVQVAQENIDQIDSKTKKKKRVGKKALIK